MPETRPIAAVILAAGMGKRMRSDLPKVLHPVCGEPMIDHVLRAVRDAGVSKNYVVVGHKGELVSGHVGNGVACVEQRERLGTGHAVMQATEALADFPGDVVVTYGDMPLIKTETYRRLIEHHQANHCACTMLTAHLDPPTGYGRIVRDQGGQFSRIVEEKDCSPEEKRLTEINTGLYCFNGPLLFDAIKRVGNQNAQGEYYLTDVPAILLGDGHRVDIVITDDVVEVLGVNSREQQADVSSKLRMRLLGRWMDEGITIVDPATTIIESGVTIGHDSVIEPFSVLRGATQIGERCTIGPHAELIDARIGDEARVRHSVVEQREVAPGASVGPFEHLK